MTATRATLRSVLAGARALPWVLTMALVACGKAPPAGDSGMMPSAPPPVTVAAAIEREVAETDEFAGRFEATQHVDLRARVNGYLQAIHFTPGDEVAAGTLLFEIDPAPFAARLAEAEAAAGNTRAQLALAELELARQRKMLPSRATSRREFEAANAAVATLEAARKADAARIDAARVDLGYTRITAPVAGRMGKDELTIGNLIRGDAPDSPRLSTLVALDPIYVSFEADEAAYLKYIGKDRSRGLKVQVGLANEEGTPHNATLQFVDNQINMASGTVRLRAELPNPDRRFTPGLYARVRLAGGSGTRRVVMVQDSAIGTDQSKRFVLALDADKNAQYREIKPGRAVAGLRVVESGLKAGEQIVIDGLQRVRPGSPVTPSVVDMAPADASAAPVSAAPVAPSKDAPAATAETPAAKANAAPASAEALSATAAAPKAAAETPEPTAEAPKACFEVPKPGVEAPPATSAPKPAASTKAADANAADAAPTSAAPNPYSADWLRQQAPESYALQLLAGADREGSERFLKHHALTDKAAILETRRAAKPWFVVVTGHYPDAAQAQAAVAELSPELRKAVQAWPRSVKALAALTH